MGLSKLGIPVSFMGKVGDDPFGQFLKQTLEKNKVNTDYLLISTTKKTTLAFVSLQKNGERDFVFFKGAHDRISPSEVSLPKNTRVFHFGSLLQTNLINQAATKKLIREARKQNAFISYDPNLRESLWDDLKIAREVMKETIKLVDILKINENEALFLTNEKNPKKAAEKLFSKNLDALFITQGGSGTYYKTKMFEGLVQTIKVKVVDTTGAGDAFNAGFLAEIKNANTKFSDLSQSEVEHIVKKANIIASLTTTKKGAVSAFPSSIEIKNALRQ